MTLGEKYYNIAMDDLLYLEASNVEGYYNQPTNLCQQVAEKLMKSVVADYYTEDDLENILRSHSLKRLANAINLIIPSSNFDKKALAYLSDFYYETRYPGPDYVKIDKETYEECKQIMYTCKDEIDRILLKLQENSDDK
ncbi:MAG: HEPN domain-containing protein [Clostridiales bacterium]|nr:HEPN domain-containing protein [Clostridiales bacterium]